MDVSGPWNYDWQTRDNGEPFAWDGHFHGTLQHGDHVSGDLGYPREDPATLFGDQALRGKWLWTVMGSARGGVVILDAPAPNTAWDDDWRFVLTGDETKLTGLALPGRLHADRGWRMVLTR